LAESGRATHVIVAAFHLNNEQDGSKTIHLNNVGPENSTFDKMWADVKEMQQRGVKVMGMLGGAAQGSYKNLVHDFDAYYKLLSDCIETYKLDGMDLDIEEHEDLDSAVKLIERLKESFGPNFIITLAPVARSLRGSRDTSFSGFNYSDLEEEYGHLIDWYNVQFYSGFGSMVNIHDYVEIVETCPLPANRIVAGVLTNSGNGDGYVEFKDVVSTVKKLAKKYPNFGGVAGWEYWNSTSLAGAKPWQWAEEMRKVVGTNDVVLLSNDVYQFWGLDPTRKHVAQVQLSGGAVGTLTISVDDKNVYFKATPALSAIAVPVTASGSLAYAKLDGDGFVEGENLTIQAVLSYNKIVVLLVKEDKVVAIFENAATLRAIVDNPTLINGCGRWIGSQTSSGGTQHGR